MLKPCRLVHVNLTQELAEVVSHDSGYVRVPVLIHNRKQKHFSSEGKPKGKKSSARQKLNKTILTPHTLSIDTST